MSGFSPVIYMRLDRLLPSHAGVSCGGAFSANKPDYEMHISHLRYPVQNTLWLYGAGLVYGRTLTYWIGGMPYNKEAYFPHNQINPISRISSMSRWGAGEPGGQNWMNNIPKVIYLPGVDTGVPTLYSWHDSYDRSDIVERHWEGLQYGISYLTRVAWDPCLAFKRLYSEPSGYHTGQDISNPAVCTPTDRDVWTPEQWPYGGPPLRLPQYDPNNPYLPSGQHYSTGSRPCWIMLAQPYPIDNNELVSWNAYGSMVACISRDIVFWFMPTVSTYSHHRIFTVSDWLNQLEPDVLSQSRFFMGVPVLYHPGDVWTYPTNYIDPDTSNRNICWGYYYNNVPESFSPDYPRNSLSPALPNRFVFGETEDFGGNTAHVPSSAYSTPHIGIDPVIRLPYVEFPRPNWLDFLPTGCTVRSATAQVRLRDVNRREFKILVHRQNADPHWPNPNAGFVESAVGKAYANGSFWFTSGKRGWVIEQKSKESDAFADSSEVYKVISKVVNVADGNGGEYPEADNTHVHRDAYEQYIWDEFEVDLQVTQLEGELPRKPPEYIPLLKPWYDHDYECAPAQINQLQGGKLAHCIVGLQRWGSKVGSTNSDLRVPRSLKEMERFLLWHPNGVQYSGFEPDYESDQVGKHIDTLLELGNSYLEWLKQQSGTYLSGLDNYRYRFLNASKIATSGPLQELFPDDNAFHEVNLKECFQALIEDTGFTTNTPFHGNIQVRHDRYRIYPCLPHKAELPAYRYEDLFGRWYDTSIQRGHYLNAACLFAVNMPRLIHWTEDHPTGYFTTRIEDIVWQDFASWEIKNIRVIFRDPLGRDHEFAVSTPWD